MAANGDIGHVGDRLACIVVVGRDRAHLSGPVDPEHDLVGVLLAPDVVGGVVAALSRHGDAEAARDLAQGAQAFLHHFAHMRIGLDATGIGMVGAHAPGLRIARPDGLGAVPIAPDVIANDIALGGVLAPAIGRGPFRGRHRLWLGLVLTTGEQAETGHEGEEAKEGFHGREEADHWTDCLASAGKSSPPARTFNR
ncbi:MAG: hypothetical protein BWX86_02968 [Verrucomicrobia bacterium ADurb.Bin122]|nr:MAG: hypothetical protein BWX86_02968 [Verrucomicrobia bacterium ADurb.Bin122]